MGQFKYIKYNHDELRGIRKTLEFNGVDTHILDFSNTNDIICWKVGDKEATIVNINNNFLFDMLDCYGDEQCPWPEFKYNIGEKVIVFDKIVEVTEHTILNNKPSYKVKRNNYYFNTIYTEDELLPVDTFIKFHSDDSDIEDLLLTDKEYKHIVALHKINTVLQENGLQLTDEEWKDEYMKKFIITKIGDHIVGGITYCEYTPLAFRSESNRDLFMSHHMDLLKDFFNVNYNEDEMC